jgi:hypothetical protein
MGNCALQKAAGGTNLRPRSARFVAHYQSMTTSAVRQFRLPLSTSGYRRESVERPNAQHKQVRKPANAANLYVPQFGWRLHVKSEGRSQRRNGLLTIGRRLTGRPRMAANCRSDGWQRKRQMPPRERTRPRGRRRLQGGYEVLGGTVLSRPVLLPCRTRSTTANPLPCPPDPPPPDSAQYSERS